MGSRNSFRFCEEETGRLIVIDESNPQCNIAGDVASVIGDGDLLIIDGQLRK